MVAARSKARGVSEADYMAGNLLKREVTAEDVAEAFVYLGHRHQDHGGGRDRRWRQYRGLVAVDRKAG